ncbi:uncharacterized protein LOC129745831 [Uranotaenia lowii]|uniref:uncharacterized protein LOC129745831 n=1 Tax=Uranotaenia lowii TaxID=190385 RepID=UPI002478FCAE|nr:uncharacterized protein LOC129745831 [Uranotaenia lowii]
MLITRSIEIQIKKNVSSDPSGRRLNTVIKTEPTTFDLSPMQNFPPEALLAFSLFNPGRMLELMGFSFPIRCDEDVERLEKLVTIDNQVREQYVRFLATVKKPRERIHSVMKKVFTAQALSQFTYHGLSTAQCARKAMKNYSVFTDCFLDAWLGHGITTDMLKHELMRAVQKAKLHLNNARYYQRYKYLLLAKRKERFDRKRQLEGAESDKV